MSFIQEFKKRGYFYQCTQIEELEKKMSQEKVVAYVGFDCTAGSLHAGNLMQIMILRLLQKHGHKPIILIGGGTTKIGDPTGKEKTRKCLNDKDISKNILGIQKCLSKFIQFGNSAHDAMILNNSDWLDQISYVDFLRNYGKNFSISRMLTMESVKNRLARKQSLTFLEFNYTLLQAYDFYYLNKTQNCSLQLGGSDQWGNIITGVDLIKKISGKRSFGLTTPLLITSSGVKMGKSLGGAIWLNEDYLSPYEYYQYWRNTEDSDVTRFSKLYCEFSTNEEKEFKILVNKNINEAKRQLAYKITEICHGEVEAQKAMKTAIRVFEQRLTSNNLPSVQLNRNVLSKGVTIIDLLVYTGITNSKGEGRRLIRGMGIKVNDVLIEDENLVIDLNYLKDMTIKISLGKKRHVLVKL